MSTDAPGPNGPAGGNSVGSEPIWRMIVRWLLGKDSTTVILSLQLAAIGWIGWWAIREGVPAHIASIQAGYREHVAELRKVSDQCEAQVSRIAEKFEADQSRDAKAHSDAMEIIRDMKRLGFGHANPANVAGKNQGS